MGELDVKLDVEGDCVGVGGCCGCGGCGGGSGVRWPVLRRAVGEYHHMWLDEVGIVARFIDAWDCVPPPSVGTDGGSIQ